MADIDVALTIPAGKIEGLKDAIAAQNGYNAATDGTKTAFAIAQVKRVATEWLKDQYRRYQENEATSGVDTNPDVT